MAKKEYSNPRAWSPALLTDALPIADLIETNENFDDFLDVMEEYQSGVTTTTPERLGVNNLVKDLKALSFTGANTYEEIVFPTGSTEVWTTDSEQQGWNGDMVARSNLNAAKTIITQAYATVESHFTSEGVEVNISLPDFVIDSSGEVRTAGDYRFDWSSTYTSWMYDGQRTTLSSWGITIDLHETTLVDGDYFIVTFDPYDNVNEYYSEKIVPTKISQLENDGPDGVVGHEYINYRDIINLTNLSIELYDNTDSDYINRFSKKAQIQIPDGTLYDYEAETFKNYFVRVSFNENYAAYCSQVTFTDKNIYGKPVVTYYTTSGDSTITVPSVTLIRNKRVMPDEYEPVAFLRSTGTQYLDTGLDDSVGYIADLLVNFDSWTSGDDADAAFVGDSDTVDDVATKSSGVINGTNGKWGLEIGSGSTEYVTDDVASLNTTYSVRVNIQNGASQLYAGNEQIMTSSTALSTKATPRKIYLFASNSNGTAIKLSKSKNYRARFYSIDLSELIADMEPCYRKSDMRPGYWDYEREIFVTTKDGEDELIIGVIGNLSDYIISGPNDPTIFTVGNNGQIYKQTTDNVYFICQIDENGNRTWRKSMLDMVYD